MNRARDFLKSLLPVTTGLGSEEVSRHIPDAIRAQSFFSARTVYAEHLAQTQADIALALGGNLSPAQIRTNMRLRLAALGYSPEPGKEGGLQDLSSDMRTALIINQNTQRARGYADWRESQDEDLLDAFPAREMYRATEGKTTRDWQARWNGARDALGERGTSATYAISQQGPFVALVNDPIWAALSRFGDPYPPFDYNSGMWVRDVGRKDAEALGLFADKVITDKFAAPKADPMEQVVSSPTAGMDEDLIREWMRPFGDRAVLTEGRVYVAPEPSVIGQVIPFANTNVQSRCAFGLAGDLSKEVSSALGKDVRARTALELDTSSVGHAFNRHGSELRPWQRDITREDIMRIPETIRGKGKWRASTAEEKRGYTGDAVTFEADSGETICFRVKAGTRQPRMTLHTIWAKKQGQV
jgi:hypothetical protein